MHAALRCRTGGCSSAVRYGCTTNCAFALPGSPHRAISTSISRWCSPPWSSHVNSPEHDVRIEPGRVAGDVGIDTCRSRTPATSRARRSTSGRDGVRPADAAGGDRPATRSGERPRIGWDPAPRAAGLVTHVPPMTGEPDRSGRGGAGCGGEDDHDRRGRDRDQAAPHDGPGLAGQCLLGVRHGVLRRDLVPRLLDATVLVDQERGADDAHVRLAVVRPSRPTRRTPRRPRDPCRRAAGSPARTSGRTSAGPRARRG